MVLALPSRYSACTARYVIGEKQRIDFLVRRNGVEDACAWVERTLELYQRAITSSTSHAATSEYRPRFEQSIREFKAWLAGEKQGKAVEESA
jgi:hypothetical protein